MPLKEKIRKFLKQFWNLVWKDESWKGWIFSLIFIFILVKFIFFPLLNLITGTALPLVVVESCSMYHHGNLLTNFDTWWESSDDKYQEFAIAKENFSSYSLKNGFNQGDIIISFGVNPENLKVGDIIIFNAAQTHPIIHRIVEIKEQNEKRIFSTIGDNNRGQLAVEKSVQEEQIIGRAIAKLSYIGWIKLFPINLLAGRGVHACVAGV